MQKSKSLTRIDSLDLKEEKSNSKLHFNAFKLVRKKKSSDSKRKVIKSHETVSDEDDMVRNSLVFGEKSFEKVKGVRRKDVFPCELLIEIA